MSRQQDRLEGIPKQKGRKRSLGRPIRIPYKGLKECFVVGGPHGPFLQFLNLALEGDLKSLAHLRALGARDPATLGRLIWDHFLHDLESALRPPPRGRQSRLAVIQKVIRYQATCVYLWAQQEWRKWRKRRTRAKGSVSPTAAEITPLVFQVVHGDEIRECKVKDPTEIFTGLCKVWAKLKDNKSPTAAEITALVIQRLLKDEIRECKVKDPTENPDVFIRTYCYQRGTLKRARNESLNQTVSFGAHLAKRALDLSR